jgi:hypothetical protein
MNKRVARFASGALLLGGLVLPATALLGGQLLLVQVAAAYLLTLVPAFLTLVGTSWAFQSAPDLQLLAGLGGSMVRMALALGGGLALRFGYPEAFGGVAFWLWLAGFYFVFLTLEIALLVRGPLPARADSGR